MILKTFIHALNFLFFFKKNLNKIILNYYFLQILTDNNLNFFSIIMEGEITFEKNLDNLL